MAHGTSQGEAVVDTEVFFDSFTTLADDRIPGRDFEIPRDLFGILASAGPRA